MILFFWFIAVLDKIGYYLYFWQVKEYRFDRVRAQLKEPGGMGILFTKNFYVKILCVLILAITYRVQDFFYLVFFLYGVEVVYIFFRAAQGSMRMPIWTKKAITLFSITAISVGVCYLLIPFSERVNFALYLLEIDLLAPVIVSFWVALFKPISFLAKQRLVAKAVKKRARMENLIAVAITGSFGKTSTKEFLAKILSEKFLVAKTNAHENTEIGAARAILAMPADTQILIAEEAAYRKGDIKEISAVVKPRIGIINGIGSQHLALFGSQQAIIDTKFELANALHRDGVLILNWDNEYIKRKAKSEKRKIIRYSIEDKAADIFASDIDETLDGSFFTIHHGDENVRAQTVLLGKHNISNLLAASAVALEIGMSLEEIATAIADIKAFERTLAPRKGINNSFIIDDTYNASFEGVVSALDVLSLAKGKKIMVFTSLIELGEKAKELHAIIGRKIKEIIDVAIIVDEKYRKELESEKTIFITDPVRVIGKVKHEISTESVVLLEGRIPQSIIDTL